MKTNSSFRIVFGDSAVIKVIDFLLDNREFDYSLTEIARQSDVAWSTLHEFWSHFAKVGLVWKTRSVGRAEMYKLNIANPIIKKLLEIDLTVSKELAFKEAEKQKVVA